MKRTTVKEIKSEIVRVNRTWTASACVLFCCHEYASSIRPLELLKKVKCLKSATNLSLTVEPTPPPCKNQIKPITHAGNKKMNTK